MIPNDIDRNAPVVVRLSREIAAPCDKLWAFHTTVTRWPEWQMDIANARLDAAFAVGNSFTWTSTGLDKPVTSTIYSVETQRSTLWGGPAAGIMGVHRWIFTPILGGTEITTEESWEGNPIRADPQRAQQMLEGSLNRWLNFLAAAAIDCG